MDTLVADTLIDMNLRLEEIRSRQIRIETRLVKMAITLAVDKELHTRNQVTGEENERHDDRT